MQAASLGLADIKPGDWVSFEVRLGPDSVDSFAALTGDRSPIHVCNEYARRAGFRSRIVHGMLSASYLSTVVGMFLPGRRATLMGQKADFLEPVPVGATIMVTARVLQVSPAAQALTLGYAVLHGGVATVKGKVTVRIREDASC